MKTGGDTTIDSKVYNKVLLTNDSISNPWTSDGYIRETSDHKVYFSTNPTISEFLIYNFNLTPGDSVSLWGLPYPFIADTVDSVQVSNGEFRKRWVLSGCAGYDTWIEGIGSLYGLIYSGENCMVGEIDKLVCMLQNDIIVYHDPHYSTCSTPLYIPDINDDPFVIYPNPAKDKCKVQCAKYSIKNIEIFNLTGEKVYRADFSSGKGDAVEVDLDFPAGIYFVRLTNDRTVEVRKIVKQ
jgi:hypothetical protein